MQVSHPCQKTRAERTRSLFAPGPGRSTDAALTLAVRVGLTSTPGSIGVYTVMVLEKLAMINAPGQIECLRTAAHLASVQRMPQLEGTIRYDADSIVCSLYCSVLEPNRLRKVVLHPFGLILLGTITLLGVIWLRSKPAPQRRKAVLQLLILIAVPTLIYMAVSGKLHWLGALIAALLPFARRLLPLLRFLPLLGRLTGKPANQNPSHRSDGNQSEISTRILHMVLDHDSGVMHGTVLEGPLKDRELGDLSETEFLELLNYCRSQDEQSARVLETYLDKRFGERWRQDDQHREGFTPEQHEMNDDDAWSVLGLEPGASQEEIIQAHRRLMQKVHPDRGGSHYLAAQINEAKDRLMK